MYIVGKIKKNIQIKIYNFMNKEGNFVSKMREFDGRKFKLNVEQRNKINKLMPTGYSLRLAIVAKKEDKRREHSNQKIRQARSTTMLEEDPLKTNQIKRSKLSRKIAKKIYQKECIKDNASIEPTFNDEQECFNILFQLKKQSASKPFLKPVDADAQGVPDYYDIIKDPMDLSTIQKKLKNREYGSKKYFHDDIKKIFVNSYYFNHRVSEVYKATVELEKFYLSCIKDEAQEKRRQELQLLQKRILEINKKNEAYFQLKKNNKEIRFQEEDLKRISGQLKNLQQYELKAIYQLLTQYNGNNNVLQIDLTTLDKKKILLIQRYLCLKDRVFNRGGGLINNFQQ